jgi:hypothetical protein
MGLIVFAVSAAGTSLAMQPSTADASHPSGLATASQRSASVAEEHCVGLDPNVTTSLSTIQQAMVSALGDNWDYTGNNKVSFAFLSTDCNYLGTDLLTTEIRVWVKPDWNSVCGTGFNCVVHWSYQYTVSGTGFYAAANVYMREEHSTNYHIINHEHGHTLGLADPGSCAGYYSVMHDYYYCGATDYTYPQEADRAAVDTISNY